MKLVEKLALRKKRHVKSRIPLDVYERMWECIHLDKMKGHNVKVTDIILKGILLYINDRTQNKFGPSHLFRQEIKGLKSKSVYRETIIK